MLLDDEAALADRQFVALGDQPSFLGVEDFAGGQPGGILAAAVENDLGAAIGEHVAAVRGVLHRQRHRNVVDHQFEEALGLFQFDRQCAAIGDVLEQRDQEFRLAVFVAGDHAVAGENAIAPPHLDGQLGLIGAGGGLQRALVRRADARRGARRIQLVGGGADDLVAAQPGQRLERPVGQDVAAIFDALGSDADRDVVDHRFQELLGGRQLLRHPAQFAAIVMGRDGAAIGEPRELDLDAAAVGQFGNVTLRQAGVAVELVIGEIEHPAGTAQRQQISPGHSRRDLGARQFVHLEIAIVAEHDPARGIGDDDALLQLVQHGIDQHVLAAMGAALLAQHRGRPQRGRAHEGRDDEAADQQFPEDLGLDVADVAGGHEAGRRVSRRRKQTGAQCSTCCPPARFPHPRRHKTPRDCNPSLVQEMFGTCKHRWPGRQ